MQKYASIGLNIGTQGFLLIQNSKFENKAVNFRKTSRYEPGHLLIFLFRDKKK